MPGQRDPNKKYLSLWMEKGNTERLREYAQKTNRPLKDLIEEAIKDKCKEWGVDYQEYQDSKYSNRNEKKD